MSRDSLTRPGVSLASELAAGILASLLAMLAALPCIVGQLGVLLALGLEPLILWLSIGFNCNLSSNTLFSSSPPEVQQQELFE